MITHFKYDTIFLYIFNNYLFKSINLTKINKYNNNNSIIVFKKYLLYTFLHIKLSTYFTNARLLDNLVYETFNSANTSKDVLLYIMTLPNSVIYLYIFVFQNNIKYNNIKYNNVSVTEFFYNASWLERESMELSGIKFMYKKDTRNLMLQFGDFSYPFKKKYPTIGFKEFFYNGITDKILYKTISTQI